MDEEREESGCEGLVRETDEELTTNMKWIKFHRNEYKFPPPDVPSMYWNTAEWVAYIDKHGEWL